MKKTTLLKKFAAVILCTVLAAASLSACGGKSQNVEPAGAPASLPTQQNQPSSGGQTQQPQPAQPEKTKTAQEYYEEFLFGDNIVSIDYDAEYLPAGDYDAFTLAETVKNGLTESYYDEKEYLVGNAWYALIDCGADGEPELALDIEYVLAGENYDSFEKLFIIKVFDGVMKIVADDYTYYRTNCTISENGFISSGGSSSAFSYYQEYSFVNAEGERVFLYSCSYNMGLKSAYIPSYELPEDIDLDVDISELEWEFVNDGIELDIYNFDRFETSYVDDEDAYNDYLRGNMFVFSSLDGESIRPEEAMDKAYTDAGVVILSGEEMQDAVEKHCAELGADGQITNSGEADWQLLDPETTPWLPKG